MLRSRLAALLLILGLLPHLAVACEVRDFLTLPLPHANGQSAELIALELAYPGIRIDGADIFVGEHAFALGEESDATGDARLAAPSIRDLFTQTYPLAFDLTRREEPWFDPGRARHDGLLRALYGDSEAEVAAALVRVQYAGTTQTARFAATSRQCAAVQLQAAIHAIAAEGPDMDRFFREVGGSFNWRRIAGTDRLSAHSFGIAVDFNTALGGYWRWSGAEEGNAGAYDNRYPEELVRQMERHGFIWGGKWHHFDGMHFEYRPELILYARLVGDG